jgi:hypothetical protein
VDLGTAIFFVCLLLAAGGVVSPAVALAGGIAFGFAFEHPFHLESHSLAKLLLRCCGRQWLLWALGRAVWDAEPSRQGWPHSYAVCDRDQHFEEDPAAGWGQAFRSRRKPVGHRCGRFAAGDLL